MTTLRNFILSFDKTSKTGSKEKEFLRSLSSIEDTFLKDDNKETEAILTERIVLIKSPD